jgi:hypothetical protein
MATIVTACGLTAVPAQAESGSADSYAGSATLSLTELRALRGGLMIAGVDLEFGATVRVLLDGRLAAETLLTLSDTGDIERSTTILDAAVIPFSGNPADLTADDLDVSGLAHTQGVLINDGTGFTAALHDIMPGHATSMLVNAAPGRNLQQIVDVQVTINNFSAISDGLRSAMLIGRIANIGGIDPALSLGD